MKQKMNYRLCEQCKEYAYSTGKDYDDFIGEYPMALILRNDGYKAIYHIEDGIIIIDGIEPEPEVKGLCPFCNPTSVHNTV